MSYILDALKKNEVEANPAITAEVLVQRPTRATKPWLQSWIPWAIGGVLFINLAGLGWYFLSGSDPAVGNQNLDTELTRPGASRELVMAPARAANSRPAYQPNPRPTPTAPATANSPSRGSDLPRRIPDRTAPVPIRQAAKPPAAPPATKPPTVSIPAATVAPTKVTPSSSGGRVLSPEQARQLGLDGGAAAPAAAEPPAAAVAASEPSTPVRKPASSAITIDDLPAGAKAAFPDLEFSTHIFADDPSMRAVVVNDKRLTEGEQFGELVLRAVTEEGVVLGYRGHLVRVSIADLWAQE